MSNPLKTVKVAIRPLVPAPLLERIHRRSERIRHEISRRKFIDNLRDTDVFLVGHPKSGNTWLAYMLAVLLNNDKRREVNTSNVGDYVPTIHASDESIGKYASVASPRIFRNEGPKFPDLYPKTIYILRDPRSVMLSYYHHCVHDTGNYDWKIADFVDEILQYGCIRELEPFQVRWDEHVTAWSERKDLQSVIFVRYEDLKADAAVELRGIAEFLDLDFADEDIALAVDRGKFGNMRQEEKTFGAESFRGEKGRKGFFVRKGKTDSWKSEMPASVRQTIESSFGEKMREFGYLEE